MYRAMNELREKGFEPDGIVLSEDEARYLLRDNFNFRDDDPLPRSIELFGLPVRVRD